MAYIVTVRVSWDLAKNLANQKNHGLVIVVWTERDGDVVRIISARWATRNEQALFRSHIRRMT